jgi:hypothetical protein
MHRIFRVVSLFDDSKSGLPHFEFGMQVVCPKWLLCENQTFEEPAELPSSCGGSVAMPTTLARCGYLARKVSA